MSWFSNALNATSKGITNLKSSLLGSEVDGDTEDDTHVCRVLRNYYNEKGSPLPPWLPPDPKASAPPLVGQTPPFSSSRYGGLNPSQGSNTTGNSASGLSSLWDSNPTPQQQQQQAPQSLRVGGGRGRLGAQSPFDNGRPNMSSQRSYGAGPKPTPPPGPSSSSVSSADKLRQRLGKGGSGARTTSPAGQSAFLPPPSQPTSGGSHSRTGGGGGDYADKFASRGMYDGRGGGRSGGSSDRTFIAANSPWSSNETEFMGGGVNGGGGGRQGLPSGPRRGLPNGPRMR